MRSVKIAKIKFITNYVLNCSALRTRKKTKGEERSKSWNWV
jgi:hypothetical protein